MKDISKLALKDLQPSQFYISDPVLYLREEAGVGGSLV